MKKLIIVAAALFAMSAFAADNTTTGQPAGDNGMAKEGAMSHEGTATDGTMAKKPKKMTKADKKAAKAKAKTAAPADATAPTGAAQ